MTDPGTELTHAAAMPAPMGGALPTGLEWTALERMATTLAESDVIPYRLKRKPADVAVILLAAREYGVPPLMALSKLPVVNGTPAPMGELMVALVLRAGHSIRVKVLNEDGTERKGEGARQPITPGTYAECTTRRRDEAKGDEDVLTFTVSEALSAGLITRLENGRPVARVTKTKNGQQVEEVTPWEQYPDNMLRWRAVANACRLRFPDVLLGLSYLPEELGATVDADGAPVDVIEGQTVRTAPAAASMEARTAQDAAARLEEFTGSVEVLDKVLDHAVTNAYDAELVTFRGDRLTLADAIAVARKALEAGTVDGTVGDDTPPDAPTEAAATATPTPQEEARRTDAPAPPAGADRDLVEAMVYDLVRDTDVEAIRGAYRGAKEAELLDVDVTELLPLEAGSLGLGAPVQLGALIMGLAKQLSASGKALVYDDPPADWTTPTTDEPPL